MNESMLSQLLQLRLAVGYLGERNQYGWWPTSFFDLSSKQFLEPVFVKTAGQAQYHGVVEAARRVHDERLSVGSFHLFRLPEEMEQDLFRTVRQESSAGVMPLAPASKDDAFGTLERLAGSTESATPQGPALIGSIEDLPEQNLRQVIARAYLHAFTSGEQVFPYLVGKR